MIKTMYISTAMIDIMGLAANTFIVGRIRSVHQYTNTQ